MDNPKQYVKLEKVLSYINGEFISLKADTVKYHNQLLRTVLDAIIAGMKAVDPLFKALYRECFYGGSYYDGLRVGEPEEFDLDLVFSLPKLTHPQLRIANVPGFAHVLLQNYDSWAQLREAEPYVRLYKLLDTQKYLHAGQVRAWIESVAQQALNSFEQHPSGGGARQITCGGTRIQISTRKSGPAFTLLLSFNGTHIDIDLVACFVFDKDHWPASPFRPNPVPEKANFFIVPKPIVLDNADKKIEYRYWRFSFQEQERKIIDGLFTLKPTVKLLKKLRDNLNHRHIASYYIKTVAMHYIDTVGDESWTHPLSYVFMKILIKYKDDLKCKNIPYYWNRRNNLIRPSKEMAAKNAGNELEKLIQKINTSPDAAELLARSLLTTEEFNIFMSNKSRWT